MGALTGGLDAATRAAARYFLPRGQTPITVHNGLEGLLDDTLRGLSRLGANNWVSSLSSQGHCK